MICRTTIRRFDGDASSSLHAAVLTRGARGLRFVSLITIEKATARYAPQASAPALTVAWVPQEQIADESASPAQIDAALGQPDQVALVVLEAGERAVAYLADDGAAFPVVQIKGTPMVLVARLEDIAAGTQGQLTFGWEDAAC